MPQKIHMFISNGNPSPAAIQRHIDTTNLMNSQIKSPSALNANFIARVHNSKPGCGSCGRK